MQRAGVQTMRGAAPLCSLVKGFRRRDRLVGDGGVGGGIGLRGMGGLGGGIGLLGDQGVGGD